MVQEGNIEDWKAAGQIARQALDYGVSLIKPGVKAVDVLDKIEEKIHELGGEIAFPAQLSCNHIAAHWCADPNDPLILTDQLICLDVGAHVNGCIGDNAATVDLSGKNEKLVEASKAALDNAIKIIKQIEGRTTDLLILPDGSSLSPLTITGIPSKTMKENNTYKIKQFQIIQHTITEIEVLIVIDQKEREIGIPFQELLKKLQHRFMEKIGQNVKVTVKETNEIQKNTRSDYVQVVTSKVKKP